MYLKFYNIFLTQYLYPSLKECFCLFVSFTVAGKQDNFRITTFREIHQLIKWQVHASAKITVLMKPSSQVWFLSGPIYFAAGSPSNAGLTSCKWKPSVTRTSWKKVSVEQSQITPTKENNFKSKPPSAYALAFLL